MTTRASHRALLIDGTNYLFRAFYAMGELSTRSGVPTGAIYGFATMLQKLEKEIEPDYIACVFDTGGENFRHALYPEYKANRPAIDERLASPDHPAQELVRILGIGCLAYSGVEADDVIATLAVEGVALGWEVTIASGDKDLLQLVNDKIVVFDGMNEKTYDPAAVEEKYGVTPGQLVDYLSLVGDSSDNVPGIERVGKKTAAKLLRQFRDIEGIFANISEVKGVVGENLQAGGEILRRNRALISLRTNVEMEHSLRDLAKKSLDQEAFHSFCERYEMKIAQKKETERCRPSCIRITDKDSAARARAELSKGGTIAIATSEATAALSAGADTVYLFDLSVNSPDDDFARAMVAGLITDESVSKCFFDTKESLHQLGQEAIAGNVEDIAIMAYLIDSAKNNKLETLVQQHLTPIEFDPETPPAAQQATLIHRLQRTLCQRVAALPYESIEKPLLPIILKMERAGVLIDSEKLEALSVAYKQKMDDILQKIYAESGEEFNINSPKQLGEVLYDKLKLPSEKKTPTGGRSTNEAVLEYLARDYPVAKHILDYRHYHKLVSTYTDKLPKMVNPTSGRLHTRLNQTAVITGRLSSNNPNLQNIPIRTEEGRDIRAAFIVPAEHKLVCVDYSQIELRVMAQMSQDETLCTAFRDGVDIHRQTAAEVLALAPAEITADQRRQAKAVNFGIIYGISAFGLSHSLNIEVPQAQEYINRYFERYPKVKRLIDQWRAEATSRQEVFTMFNRRIPVSAHGAGAAARAAMQRVAINAPVQGTAADIIKMAMIRVDSFLTDNALQSRQLLQVHDELLLEVPVAEVAFLTDHLSDLMCGVVDWSIPIEVNINVTDNWAG